MNSDSLRQFAWYALLACAGTLLGGWLVGETGALRYAVISAFIPQVWSARLLLRLYENLVYASRFNRDYEGEIRMAGDTVKVPRYDPTVTVTENTGANVTAAGARTQAKTDLVVQDIDVGDTEDLVINKTQTFNFRTHDIDRAQSAVELMDAAMTDAAFRMAKAQDTHLSGLLNAATVTGRVVDLTASGGVAANAKPSDAGKGYIEGLVQLAELMDGNDVPAEGRWIVVPAKFLRRIQSYIVNSGTGVFTEATSEQSLRNGFVGRVSGFDLFAAKDSTVPATGAGATKELRCFASFGTFAGSFAQQVTEMEAMRDPNRFADKVRGMAVYGGKVTTEAFLYRLDIFDTASG